MFLVGRTRLLGIGANPTSGRFSFGEEESSRFLPPQSAPFIKSENTSFIAGMDNALVPEEPVR